MPVASNPLLQTGAAFKASRAQASVQEKAPQSLDGKGADFSRVYAQQGRDKADGKPDVSARDRDPADKPAASSGKTGEQGGAKVADSGNNLPDDAEQNPAVTGDDAANADSQSLDATLVAGQMTDASQGAQLLQAQAEAVSPALQAAVQQAQAAATVPAVAAEQETFDPDVDPLADLPVLRLALEQNAQAQGTTSAHARTSGSTTEAASQTTGQPAVNTLAQMLDGADADGKPAEGGDKAFAGLLDDGLKDLKGASSDTRVDDFANRLSALTQAATPKTANAVAPAPLHQPLAMNQGGWTEGLVNRVMYLSSQSLKSADIQLEPAELGRLDIRVNLASDQAAQITFTSAHAGVRDALEGQVHRLREMFSQQGLAQPDVNVADQSRQQQSGRQDDSPQMSGVAGRRNAESADTEIAAATAAVEQQTVVGSSTVDYFA